MSAKWQGREAVEMCALGPLSEPIFEATEVPLVKDHPSGRLP